MTNVYAHLHDQTMRTAFEEYASKRVNIAGQALPYNAESPTTDAEWIKHNLARVADSLPNGYCGRPPQRDCPHPNACLTCPDFQTTPEFLPIHRAQAATNRTLIARAEAARRNRNARTPTPAGRKARLSHQPHSRRPPCGLVPASRSCSRARRPTAQEAPQCLVVYFVPSVMYGVREMPSYG
jgi:hypothetical protein